MTAPAPRRRKPATVPRPRPPADAARQAAFDVLQAVSERDAYANLVLPGALRSAGVKGRDAAFATELTYGALRRRGTYDAIITRCADRPLDKLETGVRNVLRLGAHQLFGMKVPTHAAVSTSVDLARAVIGRGPVGFVNAVMRRMSSCSLDDWLVGLAPDDTVRSLAIRYSHPEWIVERFQAALNDWDQTIALLEADNAAPRVSLVARPGRSSVAELVAAGASPGRWSPYAATWLAGDPGRLTQVASGAAGVQDEGSQLVTLALANAPIDGPDGRWLDLCAGPGGKAALLGSLAQQRGAKLTAVELQEHRAELVRQSVKPDVEVVVADGTADRWATEDYDRVLLDVPCSGLGALRRRPESRWRKQPSDIEGLRPLQEALLGNALAAVRPGGVIGYVTCSPTLDETHHVVTKVMADRADISLIDARLLLLGVGDLGEGPTIQLWPHRHGTDAMYLALLRKSSDSARER